MKISPTQILDEIKNRISRREIFKYHRETLVRLLIVASSEIVVLSSLYHVNDFLIDQLISQFRTILKFIYSVDNENGPKPNDDRAIIEDFIKMIWDFSKNYSQVRNYLEQCALGTRKIQYIQDEKLYFEPSYDTYSNYARLLDKVKEDPTIELQMKVGKNISDYIIAKEGKSNLFKDIFYHSLMKDFCKICWGQSEIKFAHDFGDFTYEDLISFCAALKLMGDFYMISLRFQPIPKIEEETLIRGIAKLSDLPREKVELFLKYQTYDCEYQKDKLTLIQQLIKFDNYYYFFPFALYIGRHPLKMYRLICDLNKKKYEKDISIIAKKKEEQMTNEIVEKLEKYDLSIVVNHQIKKGNESLAEYDMLAFDNETSNLYICEFKWFFVGDGEKEHKALDRKIKEAIDHRKEKDKYILDNPQAISNELFGGKKINKIKEILISQNFSGNVKHDMTVIDFETLQWSVEQFESFEELMDYFLNDEFRKSIDYKDTIQDFEIEGYKFRIHCMQMR